jgi:hypothetical protein
MVQLRILSGKHTGTSYTLSSFPCVIGRGANADVRLEESGVWERHLQIDLASRGAFTLKALPEAKVAVNSCPLEDTVLRNGDLIEAGSIKMQFWLAPARQRGLAAREWLTWVCVAALCVLQVVIIYALLP